MSKDLGLCLIGGCCPAPRGEFNGALVSGQGVPPPGPWFVCPSRAVGAAPPWGLSSAEFPGVIGRLGW
ncbi:hypothetical protein ES703_90723 [subsurface metagenome]